MSGELIAIWVVASAAGVAAAQAAGPVRLGWPAQTRELVWRVAALARRLPSRRARAGGMVVIALVLAGGGLAAYAAMPAAPKRVLTQVVQAAGREVKVAFLGDPVAPAPELKVTKP